jgi:hypothetical protein
VKMSAPKNTTKFSEMVLVATIRDISNKSSANRAPITENRNSGETFYEVKTND